MIEKAKTPKQVQDLLDNPAFPPKADEQDDLARIAAGLRDFYPDGSKVDRALEQLADAFEKGKVSKSATRAAEAALEELKESDPSESGNAARTVKRILSLLN